MTARFRLVAPLLLGLCALAAQAQTSMPAPPANVVGLSASATVEVPKDLLTVVFSTRREGVDANTVQSQLKQALDAALAEARKQARPGQLEVQTGNFSLSPRYSPKGGVTGWQGSAEMVVEGRDVQAISQLTGRIPTMSIARVGFSLSRETREKVESDAATQAIARFRAKADLYARQFGFAGMSLREVQVQGAESGGYMPMMRAQVAAAPPVGDESLPVEAGKASVTVNVSGTVQLMK